MLRPYQKDIIDQTRALMFEGVKSILITSPTGSGKTILTAHMMQTAQAQGYGSWFCVHRRELVKQSMKAFMEVGLKRFGIAASGWQEMNREEVQIASVQTIARRFQKFKRPTLIIWDECHHMAAGSWAKIFKAFPTAFHVGLTATPQRLDGRGLGDFFRKIVKGPSVGWLIENKFLCPYKLFAPPGLSVAGIHSRMGDFVRSELSSVVDKPTITGDAIKEYQRLAPGKRAVVFCVSIEHSKHVVSQFQAAGIPSAHVDGETPSDQRDKTIKDFEDGKILILSNVELFGEGFDLPALEVAILLRPTQSTGLYLQQVGRALRPSPGKETALILDHAGNCERHGLPDEDREWSLDGRAITKRLGTGPNSSVRICPKCFAAQFQGFKECKICHFVFEIESKEVEHVEGDLVEIDAKTIQKKRKMEQAACRTLEDLIELGKRRGSHPRWAHLVWQARQPKGMKI